MTRQVIMVFFGEQKWGSYANEAEAADLDIAEDDESVETHGAHGEFKPHESPAIMWLPLVVLAGLCDTRRPHQSARRSVIPKDWQHKLLDWLHRWSNSVREPKPGIGEAVITNTTAYDNKVTLIFVAIACALVGIIAAWAVYQKKRVQPFEPEILARGWCYDEAISGSWASRAGLDSRRRPTSTHGRRRCGQRCRNGRARNRW